ncbi:hypothetical protein ACHAP5_009518 [Fusarium lateritium]
MSNNGTKDTDLTREPGAARHTRKLERIVRLDLNPKPLRVAEQTRTSRTKSTIQEARNKFGNATTALENALRDMRNAEREGERLNWEADQLEHRIWNSWWRIDLEAEWLAKRNAWAFARGGLLVYEGILQGARELVDGPLFRELNEAMEAAERYLSTMGDQIVSAIETVGRFASLTFDELQNAIREEAFTFDNLMKCADSLVKNVEMIREKYEKEARACSFLLDKQKQKIVSEFKQVGLFGQDWFACCGKHYEVEYRQRDQGP